MKRLLAAFVLFVPLMAIAKDAPVFDPAADPASLAAAFVKADKLKNLGGVKRAAIGQFRVEFAVENEAKATRSSSAGWGSSSADIKLVGVTDEVRQAIADQLHDKLVQDLAAAGVEVIPYEVLRENEAYKSLGPVLRTKQDPVGTQTGKSVFVGAHGTPYYLLTSEDKHLGVGSMFGALSTTQPQNIEPQIARSLDAAVFRVTLLVAFAEQNTKGGMFRTESSVSTGAGLSIIPDASQYVIVTPSGRARVYLDEGIRVQTDALQLVETTTKSEKAVNAAAGALTALMVGGGGRSVAHYEARTTPEAFTEVVTRYGLALESAMMTALRPGLPGAPVAAAPAQ